MLLDADEFRVTRSTQTTSPTSLILADSPTAMYRKAKSIAARRLSKVLNERGVESGREGGREGEWREGGRGG